MLKLPPITFKIKYFDGEAGLHFIHEVSEDCFYNAIADIAYKKYFKGCNETVKQCIKTFFAREDMNDVLEEIFEDDLQEYFIDEAYADKDREYI